MILALMLHVPSPPRIVIPPDASDQAQAKIKKFQSAAARHLSRRLFLDESELNGWLQENLALKDSPAAAAALEQAQSSVRDVKIRLLEDSVGLHALVDVHGIDVSLMLEGKLQVRDGYMRLEPTRGKLGSLPLLAGTLEKTSSQIFASPENREKFRLPPHIQDVRVEHGKLVVTSQ